MIVLLLSDDLIFTSRIAGTGADLGVSVRTAKTPGTLLNLARQQTPACVIVDLANPGLDIAGFVATLQRLDPPPAVVAYGSHVDTATLTAARAAGCAHAMPRSQFVEQLPKQLLSWTTANRGGM